MNLKDLTGSQLLRIKLAILEIVEKAGFQTNGLTPDIKEGKNRNWKINFVISHISFNDLDNIQSELGREMFIEVRPVSKEQVAVVIAANANDFINLLNKPIEPIPMPVINDDEQQEQELNESQEPAGSVNQEELDLK